LVDGGGGGGATTGAVSTAVDSAVSLSRVLVGVTAGVVASWVSVGGVGSVVGVDELGGVEPSFADVASVWDVPSVVVCAAAVDA
jgi:hypothetical protein